MFALQDAQHQHLPHRIQSGVVPYRSCSRTTEVLLITNRSGSRWLVPKGNIESAMSASASAAKEAWEEAGVAGRVSEHLLGQYYYVKSNVRRTVHLYPMIVERQADIWLEMYERQRLWLPINEAAELVFHSELGQTIRRLDDFRHSVIAAA